MKVESPVITVESQAGDVKFRVEYVDLMLTCTRGSRGIAVDLRAMCVPRACHVRGIKVTIYVYMACDT